MQFQNRLSALHCYTGSCRSLIFLTVYFTLIGLIFYRCASFSFGRLDICLFQSRAFGHRQQEGQTCAPWNERRLGVFFCSIRTDGRVKVLTHCRACYHKEEDGTVPLEENRERQIADHGPHPAQHHGKAHRHRPVNGRYLPINRKYCYYIIVLTFDQLG